METIESLKRRIDTAQDLHALVRTMKALAAVNIRELERAVESLAEYRRSVERGLQVVLRQGPAGAVTARSAPDGPLGAVVMGSDQGMCGQLNDQMAAFAVEHVARLASAGRPSKLLAVGTRVAARLEDAGLPPDVVLATAGSSSGITPLVQEILLHLDQWHSARQASRMLVFHAEHVSRAAYQLQVLKLLPVDRDWLQQLQQQPWPNQVLPTFTLEPQALFSQLIHQYLFVAIYRACAESLASENASRLAAMRGAERSIGDRITELVQLYHQQRQMAITEELLDIAAGCEALRDDSE